MSQHHWSKFWWQDYERDPGLKMCSLAAQGLWIRLLCHMHEGSPCGFLTINGHPPNHRQIGILTGATMAQVSKCLAELGDQGVFSISPEGVIFCRRMVRDAQVSDQGKEFANRRWRNQDPNGASSGEPTRAPIGLPIGSPNTLETETETESEAPHVAAPNKSSRGGRKRGTRLPDDWQPREADRKYAEERGLDVRRVTEDFRGYWLAKAGNYAVKLDWSLTWQGWCRREVDKRSPVRSDPGAAPPPPPRFL